MQANDAVIGEVADVSYLVVEEEHLLQRDLGVLDQVLKVDDLAARVDLHERDHAVPAHRLHEPAGSLRFRRPGGDAQHKAARRKLLQDVRHLGKGVYDPARLVPHLRLLLVTESLQSLSLLEHGL